MALQLAPSELGAWDRTLVMTFSESGRRVRQNNVNGTGHGTAAPQRRILCWVARCLVVCPGNRRA